MPTRSEAEEHLRIIRSLMERATIYRAISAPTALAGGLLASCSSLAFQAAYPPDRPGADFTTAFLLTWATVLLLTILANTFFLWRGSKLRGEPFLSSGMRLALGAMLPGMLCGLFFSVVFFHGANGTWLPPIWMMCYAVALLATKHFAPRSIVILGWAFLVAGMVAFCALCCPDLSFGVNDGASRSNASMGLTFGLFHLIYAACTWPRKASASDTGGKP